VSRIIPALSDNYMFLLVDEKTKVRFFRDENNIFGVPSELFIDIMVEKG
jgi:hypothetical protein